MNYAFFILVNIVLIATSVVTFTHAVNFDDRDKKDTYTMMTHMWASYHIMCAFSTHNSQNALTAHQHNTEYKHD